MRKPSLTAGQVVVLALDGSLVFVEKAELTHLEVVAFPEQPSESKNRILTPGRVGSKKISPFAEASEVVAPEALSVRNTAFLQNFIQLREQHGTNYIGDEQARAELEAKLNPPPKEKKQREPREPKQKKGPSYLQRCEECGEQPGHPNHPSQHEFKAPPPPVELCAACQQPETFEAHGKPAAEGGHAFIPLSKIKGNFDPAREARKQREPREPKAPREKKRKAASDPNGRYVWCGTDDALRALAGGNPKFSDTNSGGGIVAAIRAAEGGCSLLDVVSTLASHPKWNTTPPDRVKKAFQQLLAAGLIKEAEA